VGMLPTHRSRRKARLDVDLSRIDTVINDIQAIIDWSEQAEDPIGYFAALYKRVTIAIRGGIEANRFEDGSRMVDFDASFAGRFFEAVKAHRDGGRPTQSWQTAFKRRDGTKPLIIVQHLMTGINAHIDLDLGIVAAEIGAKSSRPLHRDFIAINTILASQVPGVLKALDHISPAFARKRKLLRHKDTDLVDGGLSFFRDDAWRFACVLDAVPQAGRDDVIGVRDAACACFGSWYLHPSPFVPIIHEILAEERSDQVAANIRALDEVADRPAALPRRLW